MTVESYRLKGDYQLSQMCLAVVWPWKLKNVHSFWLVENLSQKIIFIYKHLKICKACVETEQYRFQEAKSWFIDLEFLSEVEDDADVIGEKNGFRHKLLLKAVYVYMY